MTYFRTSAKVALGALALLTGTTAMADTKGAQGATAEAHAPVPVHMDLVTNRAMHSALTATFDEGQLNMLHATAHQQAVATVCPGFKVDPARFGAEMNLIFLDDKGKPKTLTAEQKIEIERKAMLGFGIVFGAQLAIAAYDTKSFCEAAAAERGGPDSGHTIWAAAN